MLTIALCADRACLLPATVTVVSIAESLTATARRTLAILLLTPDASPAEIGAFAAVCRHAGFGACRVVAVSVPHLPIAHGDYITRTSWARFRLGDVRLDGPTVYLDADVLVRGDLTTPFSQLRDAAPALALDPFNPSIGDGRALPGLVAAAPNLAGRPYFNAGVVFAQVPALRALGRGSLATARAEPGRMHFNDQDALNLWLLRTSTPVLKLDEAYNRFELERFLQRSDWVRRVVPDVRPPHNPVVLHFVGPDKPWLRRCPRVEAVVEYRRVLASTTRILRRFGATMPAVQA